MNKKAEMGVGTLIVFIAMLLVAAVAAGVLIQTVSSLQEKSLLTGRQAESQIATAAQVVEVSATDGTDGTINDFLQRMKLAPGSDPIKLSQVVLAFSTKTDTATLKYRDNTDNASLASVCQKNNINGYNTWTAESTDAELNTSVAYLLEEDLDDDGIDDYISLANPSNFTLYVNLSTGGDIAVHEADVNLTFPAGTSSQSIGWNNIAVANASQTFGYVTIGTTTVNNSLSAGSVTVTPYKENEGYFSVVYETESVDWLEGTFQRGDVLKLCYEAPADIGSEESIRLSFIPKIGVTTLTEIVTPDVISTERVYLYP